MIIAMNFVDFFFIPGAFTLSMSLLPWVPGYSEIARNVEVNRLLRESVRMKLTVLESSGLNENAFMKGNFWRRRKPIEKTTGGHFMKFLLNFETARFKMIFEF